MRTPSDVLCKRLDELSRAVTQGREAVGREFTMRVPAEPSRDADLVLSSAADRIRELEAGLRDVLDYAQDYAAINDERPPCLESAKKLLEPPR